MRVVQVINGKKKCSTCKQLLEVIFFNISNGSRSGLSSQCKTCRKKLYYHHGPKRKEYLIEYKKKNRRLLNKYRREWRNKFKLKVFEKFGNKCIACGFSDPRALQIDHVDGGGTKELKKRKDGMTYYKKVLEDTSGKYQLLCANCNWIKRIKEVEYFHEPTISAIIPHVSISKEFDEMLEYCIRSLGGDYDELIIVNNNAIGYAKAFNYGFKASRGEFIIAISNDSQLIKGSLKDLCDPDAVTFSDSAQFGCFFCMPRWVYEKTGGFDERFGLAYMEDNDFLLTLKDLGIPLKRIKKVFVDHMGGATVRALGKESEAITFAKQQFREKWGDRNPDEGLIWQEG